MEMDSFFWFIFMPRSSLKGRGMRPIRRAKPLQRYQRHSATRKQAMGLVSTLLPSLDAVAKRDLNCTPHVRFIPNKLLGDASTGRSVII